MLVYVLNKKKKKENMQHMISGTHTINRSHQPCVDCNPPGSAPSLRASLEPGSPVRDAGRSNKERQRLQPLASVARAPLCEVRRVRLHTAFTGIHNLLH